MKTECRANLARLAIFYGNKTNLPFLNFQPNVTTSPTLGMNLLLQVGGEEAQTWIKQHFVASTITQFPSGQTGGQHS